MRGPTLVALVACLAGGYSMRPEQLHKMMEDSDAVGDVDPQAPDSAVADDVEPKKKKKDCPEIVADTVEQVDVNGHKFTYIRGEEEVLDDDCQPTGQVKKSNALADEAEAVQLELAVAETEEEKKNAKEDMEFVQHEIEKQQQSDP